MKLPSIALVVLMLAGLLPRGRGAESQAFPLDLPEKKPDRPLSAALARLYDYYPAVTTGKDELYSNFKYTRLAGFDYHHGDGTVSRRDPSRIIRLNGLYYVWYTKRDTPTPPQGPERGTETIPSRDWDLAEIWYATSTDGFTWKEEGVAVPRPPKPQVGWRSVCTPEIFLWKGRYYLYYQAYTAMSGSSGWDSCPVTASVADSVNGPWRPVGRVLVPNGAPGDWDEHMIHDPQPLVFHGKIYLYYKADLPATPEGSRMNGLAVADDPLGPFVKCPLNPVTNSGHETGFFRFKGGVAALISRHGLEHSTIQYAPDGINFRVAATSQLLPFSPGTYDPDAFDDSENARGITWGLCHFTNAGAHNDQRTILARFDCDLSQDVYDPAMKRTDIYLSPDVYFSEGLSKAELERIKTGDRR